MSETGLSGLTSVHCAGCFFHYPKHWHIHLKLDTRQNFRTQKARCGGAWYPTFVSYWPISAFPTAISREFLLNETKHTLQKEPFQPTPSWKTFVRVASRPKKIRDLTHFTAIVYRESSYLQKWSCQLSPFPAQWSEVLVNAWLLFYNSHVKRVLKIELIQHFFFNTTVWLNNN